jgi:hypothetical protein
MKHLILGALAAVSLALAAQAEPNADIVGACRSTSSSYVAMEKCIADERKARNLLSCLDALSSWPKDTPCPTEWLQAAVSNIRQGLPCQMSEVRQ